MTNIHKYRLAIIVPCFGRPARTRRIINNILNQTINNWEAFIIGDGCPQFQTLITSGEAAYYKKQAESNNNKLHIFNLNQNYGGCGYHIINYVTHNNNSPYIIYAGNDDMVLPNHFEHYLSEIENTDLDLVAYPTYIIPHDTVRMPIFEKNKIGHSEIIVKTETAKKFDHHSEYGHDGDFILNIISAGHNVKLSNSPIMTYYVTGLVNGSTNSDIID
jgi:glycosyltransferase involved in cell wall biosynthesis